MTRAKKRNSLFGLKYIDAGSENTKKFSWFLDQLVLLYFLLSIVQVSLL